MAEGNENRYTNFRAALRKIGNARAIARHMGVSERTAKYYLAGELLPRADTIVRFPDLAEELRRDVMPELQAA